VRRGVRARIYYNVSLYNYMNDSIAAGAGAHESAEPRPAFTAIVANWQGEAWIERALSSLGHAARAVRRPGEILVVDDASGDAGPRLIAENFPRVRLLRNSRNLGFGATMNRGVAAARGEIVLLLNNDLSVREDFIARLLAPFADDPARRLFAVSARTMSWDGAAPNHLCMAARGSEGRAQPVWAAPETLTPCLFAQGGAMACRRDLYLGLGGFDPVFAQGYWEDYDLCWRAARAGFEILYEPRAIAFHIGGGSMRRRYGEKEVWRLRARNHLLFEWLNLSDPGRLASHAAWIARHVAREWLRGEGFGYTRVLARALGRLPAALRSRFARARRLRALLPPGEAPAPESRLFQIGRGFHSSATP